MATLFALKTSRIVPDWASAYPGLWLRRKKFLNLIAESFVSTAPVVMYGVSYRSAASEAGPTRFEPNPPTIACTFSTPASFSTAATAFCGLLSSSYTESSILIPLVRSKSSAPRRIPLIFSAPLLAKLPVRGSWTPRRMGDAASASPHVSTASTAASPTFFHTLFMSPPFPDRFSMFPEHLEPSLPREHGLALFEERRKPFLLVLRPHHDRGQPVLVAQPSLEGHSEAGEDRVLRKPHRHGPLRCDRTGQLDRLVEELLSGDDPGHDPELQRFLRREDPGRQDHLRRPPHADQPWEPLRPPEGGEDPQVHLGQPDGGVFRGDPDRTRQGHLESPAEGVSVDGRQHGFRTPLEDEVDPIGLELTEHRLRCSKDQGMDVRPRAESLGSLAGKHDRPDGRVGLRGAYLPGDSGPEFLVEGVAHFRTVELQDADRSTVFLQKNRRCRTIHAGTPSPLWV